ncbi:mevalonate kinase family protein, partial [Enterococcus casseliflavus]|uniref:mevalonate kinase family protein n=1 Tax=Enterococcus casseliflavus TaxID=37734 RepID=UPI003D113F42
LPLFDRIGDITRTARTAIENGTPDSLGDLMNENHALLQQLTVSSLSLDVLCEAALQGGALGAKMSGGGRGGNMLALVKEDTADKVI